MIFEHGTYRTFLRSVLADREKQIPGHSLRSFCAKIGVSNSYFSEVLSSKKALSVELAFKIAVRIGLTDIETQYFCLLVQCENETDPEFREELLSRLTSMNPKRETHDLSVDIFNTIGKWYHLAILELTQLSGFQFEPGYISKKLGITKAEAALAIDRLQRLELVEEVANGKWKKAHSYLLAESKVPNLAFRQFHSQYLEKASRALEEFDAKKRVSSTDIIAMDSKYLPEVDHLAREFSKAVMRLNEKSKIKDEVYALCVQLFPLSETSEKSRTQ